jgi:Tol biopolymer transport system component
MRTTLFISQSNLPFLGQMGMGVSAGEDKLIVSGFTDRPPCGIFEIDLPGGHLGRVLKEPDDSACATRGMWRDPSLSPDGRQALVLKAASQQSYSVDLIDLTKGVVRTIATGVESALWSPDGRWVAAVEHSGSGRLRSTLLETRGFTRGRSFTTDRSVAWSPDSRYLLTFRGNDRLRPGGLWARREVGNSRHCDRNY